MVKDDGGEVRYSAVDISPFLPCLLRSMQMILSRDVSESSPYPFQPLAQLVDLNQSPLNYMEIFAILVLPQSWKNSANVPVLVRLLQVVIRKALHEVNQKGRLTTILGIFNSLVCSPSTDEQGFCVLNSVIQNLGYVEISPYISHIWVALFNRLQYNRTLKFIKSLVIFMSLFLVKHGPEKLVVSMNAVQPDVFRTILDEFWIPNLNLITRSMELKLTSVASTRLICSLSPSEWKLCGKMLDSIVTLISQPVEDRVEEELEVPKTNDPKQFLVASLANISARFPGKYPQIITENLEPANQAALFQLCSSYGLTIV